MVMKPKGKAADFVTAEAHSAKAGVFVRPGCWEPRSARGSIRGGASSSARTSWSQRRTGALIKPPR
jgi:hypothetical protein